VRCLFGITFLIWQRELDVLPVTYHVVAFIKRKERLDTYDVGTNFNPFSLKQ
jgi:queuosine precursor transporter